MNIDRVNNTQNFKATIIYSDFQSIVRRSVDEAGMSKKVANFLVNRIHKYFPSKDYYVSMNDYVSDNQKFKNIMCCATVERKLPFDHDPDKSLYKTIYFVKPKEQYSKWAWKKNMLPDFIKAVKELSKKDWSFENNIKKGTTKEHFYM